MFYWYLKHVAVGPLTKAVFRPRVEGRRNVPRAGAAILACNHLAAADWVFLPLAIRRRVTFLAKAEYFTGRGVTGALRRAFFAGAGQVPIDRSSASAAESAIRTGMRLLAQGQLLGIFPEGTRSPDGRLYRGKTGVARMALETGVPVVPVAVCGTDRLRPPGSRLPRVRRVAVRFGEPLDFSRYAGQAGDRFVQRSVTDEIMYEIMTLSGQEYVDVYGATVKAQMDATGASAGEVLAALRTPGAQDRDRLPDTLAG